MNIFAYITNVDILMLNTLMNIVYVLTHMNATYDKYIYLIINAYTYMMNIIAYITNNVHK